MLLASVQYANDNTAEVGEAISKQTAKISPDYFAAWLQDYAYVPAVVTAEDEKAMTTVWTMAKEMGILKKVPDAKSVIWEHAIRQ